MRKVTSLLLLMLFAIAMSVSGQLSVYEFSQSSGTYTPVTGGTVHATEAWDDGMIPDIALGFTFSYLGVDYTQVTISPNGYIIFGGILSMGYGPISSTTAAPGCASAIGRDLQGRVGSEIRSETIGSAGDYIYVVQWTDAKRYGTSYPDEYMDFQIRLHQNGNEIEFVYGDFIGSTYASPIHPEVGLRGATNADYKNRTTATNWLATTSGATNSATCAITSTVIPPAGLSFLYSLASCPAPITLVATNLTTTSADLGWTPFGTEALWNLEWGSAGFVPGTGTLVQGLTSPSYQLTNLTPVTNYNFYVQADCGTDEVSAWAGPYSFWTTADPLSGSYTINSTLPTGGTNFNNFTVFATAMNLGGFAGPVIVDVVAGTGPYTEQIILGQLPNSSAVNTLTINGNGATLQYLSTNTNERATLKMNGTDYVTIDNMIFKSLGTLTTEFGFTVQLMNNADYNTFTNCEFITDLATTSSNFAAFVTSNSATAATTAGLAASYLTVDNCKAIGGYYCMVINGPSAAPYSTGNVVTNNEVKDFYMYGLYLRGQYNSLFDGNVITRPTRAVISTAYMLYLTGDMSGCSIINNHVYNFAGAATTTSAAYGIYGTSVGATTGQELLIANNLVHGFTGMNGLYYGIYFGTLASVGNARIYHNTVSLDSPTYAGSGLMRGIYHTGAGATVDIKNNIVSVTANSTGIKHCLYFLTVATITSNYNVLHMGATAGTNYTGFWNAVNYTTLADWQAIGFDANGFNSDPLFTNILGGDLMPQSGTIDNMGTNLLGFVPLDFYGVARTATPDPGAIEFAPPDCLPPSALTATNITQNTADLGWTPGGLETSWNIEWGEAGFTQGTGTLLTGVIANPYALEGLEPAMMYEFYVQSDCGSEIVSGWAGPKSFMTLCENYALPVVESFDNEMFPPICWTRAYVAGTGAGLWNRVTAGTYPTNTPHTGAGMAHYNSFSYASGTIGILVTPAIDITTNSLGVRFWMYRDDGYLTNAEKVNVHYNTAPELGGAVLLGTVNRSINLEPVVAANGWYEYLFAAPSGIMGDAGYIIFEGVSAYGNNMFIDDIEIFEVVTGNLNGNVSEATRGPIEGARVSAGVYEAFTDEFGDYEIPGMLPGTYDITCEAEGYFSVVAEDVEIIPEMTTTQDFVLGYAQIAVDPEIIQETLQPGQVMVANLTISNPMGTESLTWSAGVEFLVGEKSNFPNTPQEKQKPNANVDEIDPNPTFNNPAPSDAMFDLLGSFPVFDVGGTYSVASDGNFIYTGRWNLNQYDKYTLEGVHIESFAIPGAGLTRDLTFDGQYFYGSPNSAVIYQMDFETKTLVSTITATGSQVRGISYDADNDAFWVTGASFAGPLRLISRAGTVLQTVTTTLGGMTGLAYDNITEGGPYLWVYTPANGTGAHILNQVSLTTGATISSFSLAGLGLPFLPTGSGGGLFITDAVVPGKWTFLGCAQNELVWILELADSTTPWLTIAPRNGVIAPGESQIVDVTLDATGLTDTTYYANINITHDGQVAGKGTLTVPVEMTVASTLPPVAATLVSPVNNATLVQLQPVFEWINGAGTAFNRLLITTGTPPFTQEVFKSDWFLGETFDLSTTAKTLDPKKVHNWQIRSRNAAGITNSAIWKFTTIGAGSIQGLVTDAYTGLPLEGVTITAEAAKYETTTAANGTYLIPNVTEGTYDVTASIEGYISDSQQVNVIHNGTPVANFALNIVVDPPTELKAKVENFVDVNLTWYAPGYTPGGTIIFEPFEDYTAGGKLVQQANAMGRDYWTTWSNAPGSAEDPSVSNAQAFAGTKSIVIEGTNDAILLLDDKTEGNYDITFNMYIPTGFLGYFNVLHAFAGATSEWGLQVYFDQGGAGLVDAAGAGAATFTFTYDQWIPLKVNVDLDNDLCKFYVNNNMVVDYQWSLGTFGTPGLNQLGAVNFYAWNEGGTPKYYIDNMEFAFAGGGTGELYELSYHLNTPLNGFFQLFDYGYGVVYDISGFTNVTVEKADYHHASWGTTGTWNYKMHVVDWNTFTLLYSTPVLQTTGNDQWELDIPLGSIPENGLVGIFLEPLGNIATDAYPDLSSDNALTTTNSYYGALSSFSGMGLSTIGNFLMDLWIMADPLDGGQRVLVQAPILNGNAGGEHATRITPGSNNSQIIPTEYTGNGRDLLSYNIYRDGEFLANTAETEYDDLGLEGGTYYYTVTAVYDEGESEPVGPAGVVILAPPVLLTAEADYYGVELTWEDGSTVPETVNLTAGLSVSNIDLGTTEKLTYKSSLNEVKSFERLVSNTCETAVTALVGLNSAPNADYWYEFTPAADAAVTISSCIEGQEADTYVLVYDVCGGNVVAENDDLMAACSYYNYASAVTFNATAGVSYKIYWDPYWESVPFDFTIELGDLCNVACPPNGVPEGEVCPANEYVDNFNGGCNSAPAVFSTINVGVPVCGTSSNYTLAGTNRRDTDWYEFVTEVPVVATFAVEAEFPAVLGFIQQVVPGVPGCDNITGSISPYALGAPCVPASVQVNLVPGTYIFFVSINGFTGYPCGTANDYVATLTTEPFFQISYNVFRDGEQIAETYGKTYYDEEIVNGEEYCYTVSQVVAPEVETGVSNEMCATVPLIPEISTYPTELFKSLYVGNTGTEILTISNFGLGNLEWTADISFDAKQQVSIPAFIGNTSSNREDVSDGVAPLTNNTSGATEFTLFRGSNAYGFDMYPGMSYVNFNTDNPSVYTLNIPVTRTIFAAEFDQNNMFYAIDNTSSQLFTVDVLTGAFTLVAPTLAVTDLAFDYTSNTMYAVEYDGVANSQLYTINLTTGAATLVGDCGAGLIISLACDGAGHLFGFNISDDAIYSINKLTGAKTLIGAAGFDGNYAQDMAWDPVSDIIYMSAYNNTAAQGQLRVVDKVTGATSLVGVFPGGAEICGLGFMAPLTSPWLAVTPESGNINGVGQTDLTVTFDATDLTFGTYYADILISSNDPINPILTVPVEFEVLEDLGTLSGIVTDMISKGPLSGVTITVEELRYTALTNELGYYEIVLPVGDYTVTASKTGYVSETVEPVVILLDQTTTLDFQLEFGTPVLLVAEQQGPAVYLEWVSAFDLTKTSEVGNNFSTSNQMAEKYPTKERPEYKVPSAPKQGGDNIANAVVIPALPFTSTGTTEGYLDDYNEECPYTATGAPDVVYAFTPTANMFIDVDLCASLYDTKVYIFETDANNAIACNDDLCGTVGYQSLLTNVALTAGLTYYIVVDGYSSFDYGTYYLDVVENIPPSCVECPVGALPEGELCGEDLNGGCNADPAAFAPIAGGDVICGTAWADGGNRDTDWYELVVDSPKLLTWTVLAEFPSLIYILDGSNGCDAIGLVAQGLGAACEEVVAQAVVPPGTYLFFVATQGFEGSPCGSANDYLAELTAEDAFLPFFTIYRNGDPLLDTYETTYMDFAVVPGMEYCYEVTETVAAGYATDYSNELCVEFPLYGEMVVNPESLTESHATPPQLTTQTIMVTNDGDGVMDFDIEVIFGDLPENRPSGFCVDALYTSGCTYGDGIISWALANVSVPLIECIGTPAWYHDFTNMVHELTPGDTYALTVTAGYSSTYFSVWIDWNNDLLLTEDELILAETCALGSTPYIFNFTVPAGAPAGTFGLRFRTNWLSAVTGPCTTLSYGNCCDFMVATGSPWLTISPAMGTLAPGASMPIEVTFDSDGLENGVYNANLLFTSNNPFVGQPEKVVPATLVVGAMVQDIVMPLGWSGWSAYVDPMMDASFAEVTGPVHPDMIISQHFTELFYPAYGINTMGDFSNAHGYVSKMSAEAILSLTGLMANPTVALNAGWNLFPVISECNLSATNVFGQIPGLIIAYEVAGNGIYYPAGSVFTLETVVPGKAYWVKVAGATSFTFPACAKDASSSWIAPLRHANTTNWNDVSYTGISHIVVFDENATTGLMNGDMIGAFTNDGTCAGMTVVNGKTTSLALFGNDNTTAANDGFADGEQLSFRVYRQANETEYILDVTYSTQAPNYDGLYAASGLSVIKDITMNATGIGSPELSNLTIYPNPSTGIFNVAVDNLSKNISYLITDAKGQAITEGRLVESLVIDLSDQPKGVYFIRFTGDNVLRVEKLVIR